jgi:hypothetical protein
VKTTIASSLLSLALANAAEADSPRLNYLIEGLGNAESADIAAPGADGTGHAFRLRHRLGDWARFNWPVFESVPDCEAVVFHARRNAVDPPSLMVRVLTEDGNEWQGPRLNLAETWQEYRLTHADFRFFRGGSREAAGEFDLGRAVQFQVVPTTTGRKGVGEFLVDDIRFLPDGPGWNAEGDELRPPSDPLLDEWRRTDDLVRRWHAERERLARECRQADRWLGELERLVADWSDPQRREHARRRLADGSLPWQQPPQLPPALDDVQGVALDAFRELVAAGQKPPQTLIELRPDMPLRQSRLYVAPQQEPPAAVAGNRETLVRHRVRFSEENVQQVVFTVLPLPEAMDLEGQRVFIRMRCTATSLNSEMPLVLRLFTESEERAESWGDLTPTPLPGGEWAEVVFDVANPMRGARFTPARTRSLAVRMENTPGSGEEFTLELADVRVAPPEPISRARRELFSAAESQVAAARAELYPRRDRIARLEDALREMPELRRAYLSSFESPLPRTAGNAPAPDSSPFAGLTLPNAPLRPAAVRTHTTLLDGRPALRLAAPDEPAGSEILAELYDRAGILQAAGRGPAGGLTLLPAHAPAWTPGEPHVYLLRSLVRIGERTRSYSERLVGMRTADVRAGGPDALLRHARQRRQPDWTYRLNGRCFYPRVAAYHWPGAEETVIDGVRMFGDLWMDGVRRYGFSFRPDEWDRFSRHGLGMFTSLAPSYRNLAGWDDVPPWRDDYQRRCVLATAASDSPHQLMAQVGNEAELAIWGASLDTAFPDALYQPLDIAAERLRSLTRPTAPTMYVRASSFHRVPPLPHEEVSGVNQYTGRYGGRVEDIDRNLAELARQTLWADRPMMITEWMGPKYSWASTGVGGVTRRGAAYYLERYWRAMIDTPGVIGSAEFTLNWVIAPFEDLTNQSREEAWKDRPPHSPFGGGRTADHVPQVGPRDAVRSEPTFRSMQAFHGPLYIMVNRPGPILIGGEGSDRIAEPLRRFRDGVATAPDAGAAEAAGATGHVLRLLPPDEGQPLPHDWDEPVIRTQLNPADPDGLLVSLHAATPDAAARGIERLAQAAEALAELNRLEGAMTRAVALTNRQWRPAHENYLLEFAARGYLHCGDDVRLTLDPAEFFDPEGNRRPAWRDLSAVILDTERALEPGELALLRRLAREGVHVIISAPCYAANPALTEFIEAQLEPAGTLAQRISLDQSLTGPVPVRDLGSVDISTVATFQPALADAAGLDLFAVKASEVQTLASDADGRAVIVQRPFGEGRVTLLGTSIGAAIEVHRRVTRSGTTHSLYDRDTACGLERLSRVVVNLCRAGCEPERHRPRLYLQVTPESTWVEAGEPVRLTVTLTDVHGEAVAGQLRGRVRTVAMNATGGAGAELADLAPAAPGRYEIRCVPEGEIAQDAAAAGTVIPFSAGEPGALPRVLSVHFKGFADGFIPADGAVAVLLEPPEE